MLGPGKVMGKRNEDEPEDPFVAGDLVDGRYRLIRRLSSGGAGVVYEAEHGFTGLAVALKALHNRAGDQPERMHAEARALAELRHPNIVQITDGGVTGGVVWFTMELLQGSSLRALLHQGEPIGVERALRFAIQIADGIAAAHEQEVIHRDLKPENVFVLHDDSIKVLDFGTSKLSDKLRRSAALKTTDRFRLIGTQAYMPPERLKAERTDARADIYALGHVLYEMIAGRHCWSDGAGPLDLPDHIELGMRQIHARPASLLEHVTGLPPAIDHLVQRALAKAPAHRQQTMRELGAELRTALALYGAAGAAPPARRPPLQQPAAEPEQLAATTEESVAPFSAPGAPGPARPRGSADLDAALMCGAVRFASGRETTDLEQGLRAIATAGDHAALLRQLVVHAPGCDDRLRAKLRRAIESAAELAAGPRAELIQRIGSWFARLEPAAAPPSSRAVLALGAALLLDPAKRSDAAETALLKLGGAEEDVQSFALSVLIALARTPIELHPAPRGALLALLLGGEEDSELARSELAGFVLSAASVGDQDSASVRARPEPARSPARPAGTAGPLPPAPAPPRVATPPVPAAASRPPNPPPLQMVWVVALAALSASAVLAIGVAVRAPNPAPAPAPSASIVVPSVAAAPSPPPSSAPRPPEPPAAVVPPSVGRALVPAASAAPAPPGPASGAARPPRRDGPARPDLPGSGL